MFLTYMGDSMSIWVTIVYLDMLVIIGLNLLEDSRGAWVIIVVFGIYGS